MPSAVGDIIMSVRDQIPDPVSDPALDGVDFSFATLLRWLNDASDILCSSANVIADWYGIPSNTGMDIYELPQYLVTVEQLWYNLLPCTRTAELDDIFRTKITARSWWFGPHSVHAIPRIHVWPACDTTGGSTNLLGAITATDSSYVLANATGFQTFGFHRIEDELILVRSLSTNPPSGVTTVTNILRGQGGTLAVDHPDGAIIRDCNIFFKGFRLQKPLVSVDSPLEIPKGLWPLLELYMLSKVSSAEQDSASATSDMQLFRKLVGELAEKSQLKGLRQGIQVRAEPPGPELYGGRVFIK